MGSLLDKCREIEDDTREELARIEKLPVTHPEKSELPELKEKLHSFTTG